MIPNIVSQKEKEKEKEKNNRYQNEFQNLITLAIKKYKSMFCLGSRSFVPSLNESLFFQCLFSRVSRILFELVVIYFFLGLGKQFLKFSHSKLNL